MIKSLYTCLALCCIVTFSVQGQTSYSQQKQANYYLDYSNEVARVSQKIIRCLFDNYQLSSCIAKQIKKLDRKYRKALAQDAPQLTADIRAIATILKQIRDESRYAMSEDRLFSFKQMFDQLQAKNLLLRQHVFGNVRQNHQASNIHHRMHKLMWVALRAEDAFMKKVKFNLRARSFSATLDYQALAANVQQLEQTLAQLPAPNHKDISPYVQYPYIQFLDICKTNLNSRRAILDHFTLAKKSLKRGFSNRFGLRKRSLGFYYNRFVRGGKSISTYFLFYNRVVPTFTLDPVPQINGPEAEYPNPQFKDRPVPILSLGKHDQPITPKTLLALNYHVEYINRSIARTNRLRQQVVKHYQAIQEYELRQRIQQANPDTRQRVKVPKTFSNRYSYPAALFDKVIGKNKDLPQAYQAGLTTQINNIHGVQTEMAKLAYRLNVYLNWARFKEDKFATSKQILARYKTLFNAFNTKSKKLYAAIVQIKQAYPSAKKKLPSSDAKDTLTDALALGKSIVHTSQQLLRKRPTDFIDQHVADSLLEAFPAKQSQSYSYSDIDDYIKNRTYMKMLMAIQPLAQLADAVSKAKGKYRVSAKKIHKLNDVYNKLVEKYNNHYARTASQGKLKKMYHTQTPVFKEVGYYPCGCDGKLETVNMKSMKGIAPVNFMLLADVSASMSDDLPMLKDALKYLVSIMRPQDTISLVAFSLKTWLALPPTSAAHKDKINLAIDELSLGSGTNGKKGIRAAYGWMEKSFSKQSNNRIVMATDGEFKMSSDVYNLIYRQANADISMSVFSFADQVYAYKLLKKITQKGKGNYEVVVPGNIAYKIVREAQAKKLPGYKTVANLNKMPCNCNETQVQLPPGKTRTKITIKKKTNININMTSMEGFAHNNLMLLLDVSGSMSEKSKLPLLKKSFKYLTGIMRPEDNVSIVIYAGDATVALQPTPATHTEQINEVIDNLRSRGKTNVKAGFKLAYKWINKNFKPSDNTRIILATDGEFPIDKSVLKRIAKNAKKGVYLSVFNFGSNQKKYENLQHLVEKGKGNYEHINENNAKYKLVKEAQSKRLK